MSARAKRSRRSDAPSSTAPPPALVSLAHRIRGRVRLRLCDRAIEAEALRALVDAIAETPGVVRVVARPNTGSVIVEHLAEETAIVDRLIERGGIAIAPPERSPPLEQVAQMGLAQLDIEIGKRTEGTLNLHTILAAALVAGAVVQAARGRVAGPATTLLLSALSLLERGRR